jgi:hypothetical protein
MRVATNVDAAFSADGHAQGAAVRQARLIIDSKRQHHRWFLCPRRKLVQKQHRNTKFRIILVQLPQAGCRPRRVIADGPSALAIAQI